MQKKYVLKKINEVATRLPLIDEAKFAINYQHELNASQFEAASNCDALSSC